MDRPDYQSISLSLDYESFSIDRVKIDIGHRDNPIVVIFGENAKEGISFDLRKKILLHPTDTNLLNRAECVDLAERIARVLENLSVKEEIAR